MDKTLDILPKAAKEVLSTFGEIDKSDETVGGLIDKIGSKWQSTENWIPFLSACSGIIMILIVLVTVIRACQRC